MVTRVVVVLDEIPAPHLLQDPLYSELWHSVHGRYGRVEREVGKKMMNLFNWLSPEQSEELYRLAREAHVTFSECMTYEQAQRFKRHLIKGIEYWDEDEILI
jgi:hypothetical protein